ncbi:MAG: addiction module toxin, HicA family, partial [Chitinivibrionales bacterium]|nr:addiction module toxin, HicA family [Chitinivibrionales bacterium]
MTGKELVKLLKKNGWVLDRIAGSHHIMIKEGLRSVPIPVHGKKYLPKGLVSA